MGPNDTSLLNELKPTFRFEREIVEE